MCLRATGYAGNGAREIDVNPVQNVHSLAGCKSLCLQTKKTWCSGFVYSPKDQGKCFRRTNINPKSCLKGTEYTTYVLDVPSPPLPPPSPPKPPWVPMQGYYGTQAINAAFRDGRPSNNLEEVGVIMHSAHIYYVVHPRYTQHSQSRYTPTT